MSLCPPSMKVPGSELGQQAGQACQHRGLQKGWPGSLLLSTRRRSFAVCSSLILSGVKSATRFAGASVHDSPWTYQNGCFCALWRPANRNQLSAECSKYSHVDASHTPYTLLTHRSRTRSTHVTHATHSQVNIFLLNPPQTVYSEAVRLVHITWISIYAHFWSV